MTRPPTTSSPPAISRRAFLAAAPVAAASLAAASFPAALSLGGCSSSSSDEVDVLDVSEDDVTTLESFREWTSESRYRIETVCSLAAGTLLGGTGTGVCAAIRPAETADPLNKLALLGLDSGNVKTVRGKAVGHDEGFEFLSASASDEMLVWVESNYLTSDWRVYCASVDEKALSISGAILLDEGDSDYDAPAVEAVGSTAYWIVQPSEDGSKTTEDSHLKASATGSPIVVHTSHGRFCGGLSSSAGILCAMPRVDTSGVYYQLTAFEASSGSIVASQAMPASYRPAAAIYMDGRFAFTIEASYDYGGGISQVGTYWPLGDGTWLRLAKTPLAAPGLCRGWLYAKSGSRTVLIDLDSRAYITVDAPEGSEDWGDYPIAVGERNRIYLYATVENDSGESRVRVRRLAPV